MTQPATPAKTRLAISSNTQKSHILNSLKAGEQNDESKPPIVSFVMASRIGGGSIIISVQPVEVESNHRKTFPRTPPLFRAALPLSYQPLKINPTQLQRPWTQSKRFGRQTSPHVLPLSPRKQEHSPGESPSESQPLPPAAQPRIHQAAPQESP